VEHVVRRWRAEEGALMKFTFAQALNVHGELVPAWGFLHDDEFIVNARASVCGRFHAAPSEYGLSSAEADDLAALNASRNLLAYWDL